MIWINQLRSPSTQHRVAQPHRRHQLRTLVSIILLSAATACATTQPSSYQIAATLPTPATLSPNSRWAIVLLDADGHIAGNIVVKLSIVPAKTCDGGKYWSAQVISEHRSDSSIPLYNPAYTIEGAALRIQLSTGLCDNGYAIIGGVTEVGFEGVHMPEVLVAPRSTRSVALRVRRTDP